jgi:CBS domain-containing protein
LRARVRRLASERTLVDSVYIAARSNLLDAFQEMVQLSSVLPDELGVVARTIADDSALTDMIGSALVETAPATRQDILATLNVRRRMDKLNEMIAREVEALKIREKLRVEVQSKIADTQKEIVLREQLKAIRKELGETGGEENQIAELRTKIESGDLPAEVLEEARRELDRLEDMPAGSPEYSMVRNYCEWVAELPWNRCTATPIDLGHAKGLAARRCALRTIIIPMENEPNLREEVPDHLRGEVEVKLAASIEQAVDLALAPQQGGSLMAHQKIQDVMTKEVFGVGEDASIREVARLMRDQKIGDVLVTDPQGKLCGIITDHDIVVRAVADEGNDLDQLRAKDICTADRIVTLEPSAGVENAIRLMTEKAIRRIPVVENNQPVGIVTIGDLAAQRDPNSALGQISQAAPNN